MVRSQAALDLRVPWTVHDPHGEEEAVQVRLPELVGKCSQCARMRPVSKLSKGKCKDTEDCGRAKADLDRVLAADKEWSGQRDHWVPRKGRLP